MSEDVFVCKSSILTAFLIRNKCNCFKVDLDNKNSDYLIHLFDRDENLKSAMDKWQTRFFRTIQ
jgi:hypothetical protein